MQCARGLTILTRSLVRMRMPLQALRASSHLEYDSLVLHRQCFSFRVYSFMLKRLSHISQKPQSGNRILSFPSTGKGRVQWMPEGGNFIAGSIHLKTNSRERAKLVRLKASFASTVSDGHAFGIITSCCARSHLSSCYTQESRQAAARGI